MLSDGNPLFALDRMLDQWLRDTRVTITAKSLHVLWTTTDLIMQ